MVDFVLGEAVGGHEVDGDHVQFDLELEQFLGEIEEIVRGEGGGSHTVGEDEHPLVEFFLLYVVIDEVEGSVYGTEYVPTRSGVVEFGPAQLLHLPHQLHCWFL